LDQDAQLEEMLTPWLEQKREDDGSEQGSSRGPRKQSIGGWLVVIVWLGPEGLRKSAAGGSKRARLGRSCSEAI